ncbi:MAG: hypothetical protein ACREQ5_12950 [Candidatus Dormibacteria bacterium]
MANTQAVCNSFKAEVLSGLHNFSSTNPARSASTADTFKAALYLASATLNASTTVYSATGEVSGAGYTAGGVTVTNGTNPVVNGSQGVWTPTASFTWTGFTASAFDTCLIYNSSQGNRSFEVLTFGSQSVSAGTFNLTMPSNVSGSALYQLA